FFSAYLAHPDLPSFPTRRSSDLGVDGRAVARVADLHAGQDAHLVARGAQAGERVLEERGPRPRQERLVASHPLAAPSRDREAGEDRKSTRLNSSHDQISYAVFCL